MSVTRRLQLLAATAGLAFVTVGCSGGSPDLAHSASTTHQPAPSASAATKAAPPSPSDPAALATEAALTTYRGMWADMVVAGATADSQSPRLADHATSQALLLLYGLLVKDHQKNVVIKGQPLFATRVVGVTPSSAPVAVSLVDCIDDSHWLNYRPDGELEDAKPGGKHRTTATVGFINGHWMVTRLEIQTAGTCA